MMRRQTCIFALAFWILAWTDAALAKCSFDPAGRVRCADTNGGIREVDPLAFVELKGALARIRLQPTGATHELTLQLVNHRSDPVLLSSWSCSWAALLFFSETAVEVEEYGCERNTGTTVSVGPGETRTLKANLNVKSGAALSFRLGLEAKAAGVILSGPISIAEADAEWARQLSPSKPGPVYVGGRLVGVRIGEIKPGSPWASGDIRSGDLLLALDGVKLDQHETCDLLNLMAKARSNGKANLDLERASKPHRTTITFPGPRPKYKKFECLRDAGANDFDWP